MGSKKALRISKAFALGLFGEGGGKETSTLESEIQNSSSTLTTCAIYKSPTYSCP